jgi:hypothetical protein
MTVRDNVGGIRPYSILEGEYQETYVPAVGRIRSPQLNRILKRCKIMPIATGSVTWRDLHGNQNTASLSGGVTYPFFVSEVSAAAGGILIIHDGEIDAGYE